MNRRAWPRLLVGGLVSLAMSAHADTIPALGHVDSRIRAITYNAEDVIRLKGYVGYQIDLQFEEGEAFVTLAAGDTAAIDVGAQGNHLMIKPKVERLGTNLTILTNRRVYHFDYSAVRQIPQPRAPEVIYALRFDYEAPLRPVAIVAHGDNDSPAVVPPPINSNYWFCGAKSLRPTEVYDDGTRTYLRFRKHAELPAIFLRNDDRTESLVNFTVGTEQVIVHRVAPQLVLRRGRLVGCIVNRAPDRLESPAANLTPLLPPPPSEPGAQP